MTLKEFIYNALKIKFRDKGRNYSGVDCYGLLWLGYRDVLKIELPSLIDDYVDAGDTLASRRVINDIIKSQKREWEEVDTPQPMDVVLFRFGETETHVGFVINKRQFIHCEKKINTVVERLDSAKWIKRIVGIYRLKGNNGK